MGGRGGAANLHEMTLCQNKMSQEKLHFLLQTEEKNVHSTNYNGNNNVM